MRGLPESPSEIVSRLASERRPRPDIGVFCPPEGNIEQRIAEIWCQVLRIDRIGRNDVIFDLDGDSLHMTQIATHVWRLFNVRLPIETFFENLTIGELAIAIKALMRQKG